MYKCSHYSKIVIQLTFCTSETRLTNRCSVKDHKSSIDAVHTLKYMLMSVRELAFINPEL